jgi:hypothetical protein
MAVAVAGPVRRSRFFEVNAAGIRDDWQSVKPGMRYLARSIVFLSIASSAVRALTYYQFHWLISLLAVVVAGLIVFYPVLVDPRPPRSW